MKKVIVNLLVVIIAASVLALVYFGQYPINNDIESIELALESFMIDSTLPYSKLDNKNLVSVNIIKVEDIDNRALVFFEYAKYNKKYLAYAEMKRSINGKYSIKRTGHASGRTFLTTDISTNKNVYRAVMGENYGKEIASFTLNMGGPEFYADISGEDYFIKLFEIPQNASMFDKITLYDGENNDITTEIRKKYPVDKGGGSKTVVDEGEGRLLFGLAILITSAILIYINIDQKDNVTK